MDMLEWNTKMSLSQLTNITFIWKSLNYFWEPMYDEVL